MNIILKLYKKQREKELREFWMTMPEEDSLSNISDFERNVRRIVKKIGSFEIKGSPFSNSTYVYHGSKVIRISDHPSPKHHHPHFEIQTTTGFFRIKELTDILESIEHDQILTEIHLGN